MDYKYIEQLIDRYFECETSLEEEMILRAFFAQKDVPARLLVYREVFAEQTFVKNSESLGADFDQRIMDMVEGAPTLSTSGDSQKDSVLHVKARKVSLTRRLRPLYKAAACVAVVLAIGQAAQMPYNDSITEQQEQFARTLDQLQRIQKDQNAVAKSDSVKSAPTQTVESSVAN